MCVNNQNSWNGAARTHCVYVEAETEWRRVWSDGTWFRMKFMSKYRKDGVWWVIHWLTQWARERERELCVDYVCITVLIEFQMGLSTQYSRKKRIYCYFFFWMFLLLASEMKEKNIFPVCLRNSFFDCFTNHLPRRFYWMDLIGFFFWCVAAGSPSFYLNLFPREYNVRVCALFEKEWRKNKNRKIKQKRRNKKKKQFNETFSKDFRSAVIESHKSIEED